MSCYTAALFNVRETGVMERYRELRDVETRTCIDDHRETKRMDKH